MNKEKLIKLGLDKIEGKNNLKWADIGRMFGISGEDARQIVKRYRKKHGLLPKREDVVNEDVVQKLQEIEMKKIELEKERKKLQTEKNEINKWLREQARIELFYEKLERAIRERYNLEIPQYIKPDKQAKRDAIVTIADCHYGKEVNIIGLKGEVLNIYNVKSSKLTRIRLHLIIRNFYITIRMICFFDSIRSYYFLKKIKFIFNI